MVFFRIDAFTHKFNFDDCLNIMQSVHNTKSEMSPLLEPNYSIILEGTSLPEEAKGNSNKDL